MGKILGLKLKKLGLNKFFGGLIIKHFGPYLLGALGNGLSGLAFGPALGVKLLPSYIGFSILF
jgi:hypothetical protein